MSPSDYLGANRRVWDAVSDRYQADHGGADEAAWGGWRVPEAELRILGDVAGKDVLELGCGAAQWSIALARLGARVVGVDFSQRQLDHARDRVAAAGVDVGLVLASAEDVPLPDASFDLVVSDHGALTWGDPHRTVPEAARLLRAGGVLAFNITSTLAHLCSDDEHEVSDRLRRPYFGLHRLADRAFPGATEFQLPYGEWIRLFRASGLVVEDLVELQAPAEAATSWADEEWVPLAWARRWPAENIWKVRRQ